MDGFIKSIQRSVTVWYQAIIHSVDLSPPSHVSQVEKTLSGVKNSVKDFELLGKEAHASVAYQVLQGERHVVSKLSVD